MVRLGQYFEEFVKDYLRVVKEIDILEMEYPYGNNRDIDIIGSKGDEIWIVECKESIAKRPSDRSIPEMKKKFKAIKKLTDEKFPGKPIRRFIAHYTKEDSKEGGLISEEDFKDEESLPQVEFLDFKQMVVELIQKTKGQEKSIATKGRYHWFLEKLKREKFDDKDKKVFLDFFDLNKSK